MSFELLLLKFFIDDVIPGLWLPGRTFIAVGLQGFVAYAITSMVSALRHDVMALYGYKPVQVGCNWAVWNVLAT